jgi:Resolvase, N terminal domain
VVCEARWPELVGFLSELHALKIDLFLRQQGLDTTTPAGKAMFQMMGVFAEFERAMIAERVRAGLGRPGIRVIAERFGVNPSTVQRISRPFDGASVAVA